MSADGISLWVAQEGFAFVAEALAAEPTQIQRFWCQRIFGRQTFLFDVQKLFLRQNSFDVKNVLDVKSLCNVKRCVVVNKHV